MRWHPNLEPWGIWNEVPIHPGVRVGKADRIKVRGERGKLREGWKRCEAFYSVVLPSRRPVVFLSCRVGTCLEVWW